MNEHGGPAGEAEQQEGRIHFPLVTYAEKDYHRHVHGLLNKTTMINWIMTSALNQGAANGSTRTTSPPHSRCSIHPTHLKHVSVAEMTHAYFKSRMGKPHPSTKSRMKQSYLNSNYHMYLLTQHEGARRQAVRVEEKQHMCPSHICREGIH